MIPFQRFGLLSLFNIHFISSIVILIAFYQFSAVLAAPTLESLDLSEDPAVAASLDTIAADLLANSTKRLSRSGQCGAQLGRWHGKIVGGDPISISHAPYQVSIQSARFGLSKDTHFCGGSIINENYVVTAAHCAKGFRVSSLRIVAGASDIKTSKDTVTRRVSEAIIHPKYNEQIIDNDIALLRVSVPFDLSSGDSPIAAICLPEKKTSYVGEIAYASGYGRESEGSGGGDSLRMVQVPIISNAECNKSYPNKIMDSMLCAGYPEGKKDACQGDSGGPLAILKKGLWQLIGIVSWGIGCARPNKYGVYCDVSNQVEWIRETMKK
ncbi:trypsin-1-like [Brevipalpus obovatus]|uniref:trypsin-1-like n=1 Tax=Brevipalpus obovatus TaxID=246614 RepID=UPI003D9DD5A0